MRILVVGDGKVGHTLAEHLCREEHDVVVIDKNTQVLHRDEDWLDALCIEGNGANAKTLLDAGVDKTDILIAATASDETNMLCCLIAKRLGAKYTIARIRDPEYNEGLMLLQRELGIDMPINPERATAFEIGRLLRVPFANNIETFAKGHVEMIEFGVKPEDPMLGMVLKEMRIHLPAMPRVLISAIERDGEVIIPNGDTAILAGDKLHVAGDQVTISAYFRYLGRSSRKAKNIMILGGGRIGYYLAKMISSVGAHVSLIEINPDKAYSLSEQLPDVNVICGDGTDQHLLEQEGLQHMDAFIALSSRDEENLMTGMFARQQGVDKVVVKNNRDAYNSIIINMGLNSIVSPRMITCAAILRYVRARANREGTKVEKLYRLMNGRVEAMEFIARAEDSYIGIPLANLTCRPGALVAVIVHRGVVIVPTGHDHIEAGDSVVIIATETNLSDLNEVIHK